MKLFISFTIALFAISTFSFANSGRPAANTFAKTFTVSVKEFKSFFTAQKLTAKVCACQILRVESNNEQQQYIAVFAQGTNTGDLTANFNTASNILQKEKKHLNNFFYTKIKVKENLTAASECSQLYNNIKVKYDGVKMYDILDADALSKVDQQ